MRLDESNDQKWNWTSAETIKYWNEQMPAEFVTNPVMHISIGLRS